jgi:hypothetical protein
MHFCSFELIIYYQKTNPVTTSSKSVVISLDFPAYQSRCYLTSDILLVLLITIIASTSSSVFLLIIYYYLACPPRSD